MKHPSPEKRTVQRVLASNWHIRLWCRRTDRSQGNNEITPAGKTPFTLGDTARVPYGTKSPETVIRYAKEITSFLVSRDIKLLVAACNTVSAVSLEALKQQYSLPIVGVIEPGARRAASVTKNRQKSE